MNIIFQINGGLGKSVMATAVCKSIKTKYPDCRLIVITGYPDVFLNNPYVHRCFRHQDVKYFYKDYIENQEFIFFGQEPYSTDEYVHNDAALIDLWCKLYDLPVIQNHGELYLTKREIDFYMKKHDFKTPILALQTNGSGGDLLYNWGRDIPPSFVKKIINKYESFKIYHIKNEGQMSYDGVVPFTDNIRAVAVLISLSHKRIFMDSCAQHIAASLGLSSSVLWITTSPKVFGYEMHNNLLANPETKILSLPNSYLSKYELVPSLSDFPYNDESEIFGDEILKQL